jgi:hypothetical protein
MKRTSLALTLILALLVTAATSTTIPTIANPVVPEKAPMDHAYIRDSGEVDPPTLPIHRSGNFYTLKEDLVNYTLDIQKDNVIFDGNGFSFNSPSWGEFQQGFASIQISERNSIVVRNVTFDNCFTAVSVINSTDVLITQNSMKNGGDGVGIYSCENCSIVGNSIIDNAVKGLSVQHSTFLIIAYNQISVNKYGLDLDDVRYSNVSRNDVTLNNEVDGLGGVGLHLSSFNSNNQIFENNFVDNNVGLRVSGFSNFNNTLYSNYWKNQEAEIDNDSRDNVSIIDQSPLTNPISISFDPSLFPLPSITPTPSPEPQQDAFLTTLVAAASGASATIVGLSVYLYFKKRNGGKNLRSEQH